MLWLQPVKKWTISNKRWVIFIFIIFIIFHYCLGSTFRFSSVLVVFIIARGVKSDKRMNNRCEFRLWPPIVTYLWISSRSFFMDIHITIHRIHFQNNFSLLRKVSDGFTKKKTPTCNTKEPSLAIKLKHHYYTFTHCIFSVSATKIFYRTMTHIHKGTG